MDGCLAEVPRCMRVFLDSPSISWLTTISLIDLQLLRGLRLLLDLLFSRDLVFSFSEPFREVGVQIFSASIRTELIKLPEVV